MFCKMLIWAAGSLSSRARARLSRKQTSACFKRREYAQAVPKAALTRISICRFGTDSATGTIRSNKSMAWQYWPRAW
jgi:hypothetical protein